MTWEILDVCSTDEIAKIIPLIISGEVAGLRFANFYHQHEVAAILQNISARGIDWYPGYEGRQGRIGISVTDYHRIGYGLNQYIKDAVEASKVRDQIFGAELDPLARTKELLNTFLPTELATEESGDYFAGIVRCMTSKSTLHVDHNCAQTPGWAISKCDSQLANVVYLSSIKGGGELKIYDRRWSEDIEEFNRDVMGAKSPDGYSAEVVEGIRFATYRPKAGDFVLFASANLHQVMATENAQPRYTVGSFLGISDGKLKMWN